MNRGEVWRVLILGRSQRIVVVVGHDALTQVRDDVLCVHVDGTPGQTGSLLSARIETPVAGYARAATVGPITKGSFAERLGELDDEVMEQVDIALRGALDL